jgi:hypothetical protein
MPSYLVVCNAGCGAAWLARLTGGQEVPGSNPGSPTRNMQLSGSIPGPLSCNGRRLTAKLTANIHLTAER